MSKDQITPERIAELLKIEQQAQYLVSCKGRYNAEQAMNKLAEMFGKPVPYPDHIADAGQIISDERIREILLDHGFSEGYFLSSGVLEYPDHIYAAARAIASEVAPRWKDISTVPNDDRRIMLWHVKGWVEDGCWMNDALYKNDYTHWMPSPPPPKEVSNG